MEAFVEASVFLFHGSFHESFHGSGGSFHGSFHELPRKKQVVQETVLLDEQSLGLSYIAMQRNIYIVLLDEQSLGLSYIAMQRNIYSLHIYIVSIARVTN